MHVHKIDSGLPFALLCLLLEALCKALSYTIRFHQVKALCL